MIVYEKGMGDFGQTSLPATAKPVSFKDFNNLYSLVTEHGPIYAYGNNGERCRISRMFTNIKYSEKHPEKGRPFNLMKTDDWYVVALTDRKLEFIEAGEFIRNWQRITPHEYEAMGPPPEPEMINWGPLNRKALEQQIKTGVTSIEAATTLAKSGNTVGAISELQRGRWARDFISTYADVMYRLDLLDAKGHEFMMEIATTIMKGVNEGERALRMENMGFWVKVVNRFELLYRTLLGVGQEMKIDEVKQLRKAYQLGLSSYQAMKKSYEESKPVTPMEKGVHRAMGNSVLRMQADIQKTEALILTSGMDIKETEKVLKGEKGVGTLGALPKIIAEYGVRFGVMLGAQQAAKWTVKKVVLHIAGIAVAAVIFTVVGDLTAKLLGFHMESAAAVKQREEIYEQVRSEMAKEKEQDPEYIKRLAEERLAEFRLLQKVNMAMTHMKTDGKGNTGEKYRQGADQVLANTKQLAILKGDKELERRARDRRKALNPTFSLVNPSDLEETPTASLVGWSLLAISVGVFAYLILKKPDGSETTYIPATPEGGNDA